MSQLVKSSLTSVAKSQEAPPIFDKITIHPGKQEIFLPDSRRTGSIITYLSTVVGEEICLTPKNLSQGIVGVHLLGSNPTLGVRHYLFALQYYLNMSVVDDITSATPQHNRWRVSTSDISALTLSNKGIEPVQIHNIENQDKQEQHTVVVSLRDSMYLYCPTCGTTLESDSLARYPSTENELYCSYCQYENTVLQHLKDESGVTVEKPYSFYFQAF